MKLEIQRFANGLSVKQLKELIKDWPETNQDGEPTEVWMALEDGSSKPVSEIAPLNVREDDSGNVTADLIFE